MEQMQSAEQKLSRIFHNGNKVGYAQVVIDEVKNLYTLKKQIQSIIITESHHLQEKLESLIAKFVEGVNTSYDLIFPDFSTAE